ncbi:MAG: hypothetical protein WC307_06185 [Candidatus Nanoarchaeia archaeon]|jgi:hypothetical protein
MPFSNYESFQDCVNKNRDKENPEAYCGYIEHLIKQRRTEKELNDDSVEMFDI